MPVDNRMVVLTSNTAQDTAADATGLIASSGDDNILIGELAINSNTGNFYAGCEVGEASSDIGGSAGKSTATSDILGMTLSTAATMQAVGTGASPTFVGLSLGAAAADGTITHPNGVADDGDGRELTITAGSATTGTTANTGDGGDLILQGGAGKGTEDGGSIIFKSATKGGSGATLNTINDTILTLDSDKGATFAGAVTGITDLSITGNLNITGDINSTSVTDLDVTDKTITIAKGAADSAAADGAGIVVDGASASILYDDTGTQWEFNKPVEIIGALNIGVNDTGHDVKFFGATSGDYWLWDESADGVVTVGDYQQTGTMTIGVDNTGHDVKFFGATASAYMLWDESADDLKLVGTAGLTVAGTSALTATTTTTLTSIGAVTVGEDDTGHDVKFFGATAGDYWLWDQSADGVVTVGDYQQTGTMTIGVDDAGHDVKFFGDTASAYMLWDTSADDLILGGAAGLNVDGTTDLDVTNIVGALTVGANDTGHDVIFYGATASANMTWDESADDLILNGAAGLSVDGQTDLDVTNIVGALTVGADDTGHDVKMFGATAGSYWLWDESADGVTQIGSLTVGVDNTGHDVKFFGATTGKSMLWDESADKLIVTGDMSVSGTLTATVANATNAANVYLNTDDTGDTSCSIVFTQDAGGANRPLYEDSGLLYNNTTNYITCGGLTGAIIAGGTF